MLEHYGAAFGHEKPYQEAVKPAVESAQHPNYVDKQEALLIEAAKKKSIATAFLKRADRKKYGGLWSDLENNFTRGVDHYPADLTGAYNLLLNYKPPPTQARRESPPVIENEEETSGISFLQAGEPTPGTDGQLHEQIRCYSCNDNGHYASECPQPRPRQAEGHQMLQYSPAEEDPEPEPEHPEPEAEPEPESQVDDNETTEHDDEDEDANTPYISEFSFIQKHGEPSNYSIIPNTWILLDSQSTVSVFNNYKLLSNIRDSNCTLKVHTNGGTQISTQLGTVNNFGDVWYNEKSLANILSMAAVRKVCRITMDTSIEAAMHVHKQDGTIMKFAEYTSGLYYFDTGPNFTNETCDYSFLNTVANNKRQYTLAEIQGADKARTLYRKIGRPAESDYNGYLDDNLIRNCPLTSDDAKRAMNIYGDEFATLQGKTVKHQNKSIPNFQTVKIPAPIIEQYKDVRLFIDIFWVNGSPFFHTISEWIKFRTVAPITNRKKRTLHMETQAVIDMYEARGFTITRVEGDREFACITNELLPIPINIADADDHVPQVERSVRTIKERTRCLLQGLPFKRIPKAMIRASVENSNKVLNISPPKNGVSRTLSPLTIMTGRPNINYNDLKIEFGAYAQVFEDNDPTNTVKARTTGAIALTPTGNAQGGYYFMSLTTGRKLSRQQWHELPMPDGVIEAVERMALAEQQPLIGNGAPLFEWTPGVIIDDNEEVVVIQDGDEAVQFIEEPDIEVHQEDEQHAYDLHEDENQGAEQAPPQEEQEDIQAPAEIEDEDIEEEPDMVPDDDAQDEEIRSDNEDNASTQEDEHPDGAEEDDVTDLNDTQDGQQRRHNLRPNRERNYNNRFGHAMDNPASSKSYDAHDSQFLQQAQEPGKYRTNGLREAVQEMQKTGCTTPVLKTITGIIMMQMSAKAGIKKHGQVAIDALFEEFFSYTTWEFF